MLRADSGSQPGGWDQHRIQAEIRRRGSSLAQLSRENGVARGTLQGVFYKRYPRGQAIVAAFIERTRHELWPHWYGPDDELLPLGGRVYRATRSAA